MVRQLDKSFLLVIFFLIGLGVVQVYSSSYVFAIESYGDGQFFFQRQLLFAVLGVVMLLAMSFVPTEWIEKYGVSLWLLAVLMLSFTYLPGVSIKVGGAHRWIQLPFGQRFEPGELLKVSFPLLIATFIGSRSRWIQSVHWAFKVAVVAVPLLLLLFQPDFGTFAICLMVIFGMLFAFGLKWRYLMTSVVVAVPVLAYLIVTQPYRYARVVSFLDPWADPAQKGFQVIQSLLSFHSGGFWGAGLGLGQGKLFFLPEAHTDFTLAVLGEELGFAGLCMVLMLYGFVVYRGLQISLHADQKFTRATAVGVTIWFGLSVFINVGVVLGFLPTKGLTLPFLSYGGSSLVTTCIAMGLLLNIDRNNRMRQAIS